MYAVYIYALFAATFPRPNRRDRPLFVLFEKRLASHGHSFSDGHANAQRLIDTQAESAQRVMRDYRLPLGESDIGID